MRSFSVSARGLGSVQVRGPNWISALGEGLEELGRAEGLERLACEVLPNGTVIARDIGTGTGYIVQSVDDDASATSEEVESLPIDAISALEPEEDEYEAIDAAETVIMASQLALRAASQLVPAESGAVILEEKGYLRFTAATGPQARKLIGVRLPVGTGVAGFVAQTGRSIVLADAHEDQRHCGEVDALTGYVTREIAVVPIKYEDAVLGVLELMNLPGDGRFTTDDLVALEPIAAALGERIAR